MFELGYFEEASCDAGSVCVKEGRLGQVNMASKCFLGRQQKVSTPLAGPGLVVRPWLYMVVYAYGPCGGRPCDKSYVGGVGQLAK